MKTKKISLVIIWAAKMRPVGYIDILRKMSETWDVEKDEYTITDENWNAMAREYGDSQPNPQTHCPHRTCANCSEPASCKMNSGAMCQYGPGTFDQCQIWRETQTTKK
jgi:hypothetical protein